MCGSGYFVPGTVVEALSVFPGRYVFVQGAWLHSAFFGRHRHCSAAVVFPGYAGCSFSGCGGLDRAEGPEAAQDAGVLPEYDEGLDAAFVREGVPAGGYQECFF